MGTWNSLAKGIVLATLTGFIGRYISIIFFNRVNKLVINAITITSAIAGLIYYARVWIQGFYFDQTYPSKVNLSGRTVLITGGTYGGLGFASAQIFTLMGADVIVTFRTTAKATQAVDRLISFGGSGRIQSVLIDFSSKKSIRDGAAKIKLMTNQLDFLILNAGISQSKEGGDAAVWMTNYLGPFQFVEDLTPLLVSTALKIKSWNNAEGVRVVAVSSGAHKSATIHWADPFNPLNKNGSLLKSSYGQSKLAQIMHMRELQSRIQKALEEKRSKEKVDAGGISSIKCFSVTPGAVWTNIIPHTNIIIQSLIWVVMRTPLIGAQVIKMACIDPNIPAGSYLSNCLVKPSEGINNCSNDKEQWKKLWELSERQCKEGTYFQ